MPCICACDSIPYHILTISGCSIIYAIKQKSDGKRYAFHLLNITYYNNPIKGSEDTEANRLKICLKNHAAGHGNVRKSIHAMEN